MYKKYLSLSLILALLIFVSCGKKKEEAFPFEEVPSQSESIPAETEEESETETESLPILQTVTVSLVGDCLLSSPNGIHNAGTYNYVADQVDPSYFFSEVQSVFANDDLTVANCETVFTDRELSAVYKEEDPAYWYYGPSHNAAAFSAGSVEVASVANNHALDYGKDGYDDTVAALESYGVTVGEDMEPVYVDVGDITVGVLCCNVWSSYHTSRACDMLAQMSECSDVQIVFPHGGSMGDYTPDEWKVTAYRRMIDAGAEVVAGSHSHRLQPAELYNEGAVCYSLGDFCFGDAPYHENATVIMSVKFNFTDGVYTGLSYEMIPCYLYSGQRNDFKPLLVDESEEAFANISGFMRGERESPF